MSTVHNRPSHCSSAGGRSQRWHSVYSVALGSYLESASRRTSIIAPSHTNRRSFIQTTTSHSFDGLHWLRFRLFVYEVHFACGVDAMHSDRCSRLVRTLRQEDFSTRLTIFGTNRRSKIAGNNAMHTEPPSSVFKSGGLLPAAG